MANHISKELKAKAFTLYCMDVPQTQIGTALALNPKSINNWVVKEKWVDKREQILSINTGAKYLKVSDRHLQLVQAVEGDMAKGLYEGKINASVRDGLQAIVIERLILGMSTENVAQNVKQTIVVCYDREKPKLKEKEEKKDEVKQ